MNRVTVGSGAALGFITLLFSQMLVAQSATPEDLPAEFGALETVHNAELSPDGKRIVYITPRRGTGNAAFVVDLETKQITALVGADGQPMRLTHCGWAAADRLICNEYGLAQGEAKRVVPYTRMFALNIDGKNMVALGNRDTAFQLYGRQFDGVILDWLNGSDGTVLMERYYVPEMSTGRRTAQVEEGYGVDLIDTRTQKVTVVERPKPNTTFMSDGRGVVRLMTRQWTRADDLYSGKVTHYYRLRDDREWRELGNNDVDNSGIDPVAIDSGINAAYVLKGLNGRNALYRIALDGSLKSELVFEQPMVDVDGVVSIGRNGRIIGAQYVTDVPHVEYFDADYRNLAAGLAKALPNLPLISFVSASADEKVLLIHASSDSDPGRYYVLDRGTNRMSEVLSSRPELKQAHLGHMKEIRYTAADGTVVPAYLTLPPNATTPENLPAIVMPHGGPASRDYWGFDWLAQYFASRGFAVLQPNFRGSAGFGNDWFLQNGFKSWQIAIGDINDGARWLLKQGVSPDKIAIFGWSYGGYAALQANVSDANLFKAVVAVAPVTDLGKLKDESSGFKNELVEKDYIGSGPHIEEGSPARHAAQFKAPVLMFHGENDLNVDVSESRLMDKALKAAGKQSELVVYPKLDHQLPDAAARSDMLRRAYEFLRTALKL